MTIHKSQYEDISPPLAEDIAPEIVSWLARIYKAKVTMTVERGAHHFSCETDARDGSLHKKGE